MGTVAQTRLQISTVKSYHPDSPYPSTRHQLWRKIAKNDFRMWKSLFGALTLPKGTSSEVNLVLSGPNLDVAGLENIEPIWFLHSHGSNNSIAWILT
jgi:hypothetical protein